MSDQQHIEPVEIEAPPFIYIVPSVWKYDSTDETTDIFTHREGGELYVERLRFTSETQPGVMSDALTIMLGRLEDDDIGDDHSTPVLLSTGFAFISYTTKDVVDADFVRLFCELCGFESPRHLAVIRFSSSLHRDDLQRPDVTFNSHIIRQYARMTRFAST